MWALGTGPSRTSKPVLTTLVGYLRGFLSQTPIWHFYPLKKTLFGVVGHKNTKTQTKKNKVVDLVDLGTKELKNFRGKQRCNLFSS
jgi:hypothetical protein